MNGRTGGPHGARLCAALFMAAVAPVFVPASHAGVVMAGTRVVYLEQSREKTLQLTNEGDSPSFVRSWIDDGDPDATPEDVQVPFHLTPANARIDPHRGQQLRITYIPDVNHPLPPDRESVFYLNVLDIPPKPEASGNVLQFAVRTRVKLFFRPAGLKQDAGSTAGQARWSIGSAAGESCLRVHNPSAFHLSISDATLTNGTTLRSPGMIAPGSTHCLPVDNTIPEGGRVQFHWMDDYGSLVEAHTDLQIGATAEVPNGH